MVGGHRPVVPRTLGRRPDCAATARLLRREKIPQSRRLSKFRTRISADFAAETARWTQTPGPRSCPSHASQAIPDAAHASVPAPPQLPPVLRGPTCVALGHVDAVARAGVAVVPDDGVGLMARVCGRRGAAAEPALRALWRRARRPGFAAKASSPRPTA